MNKILKHIVVLMLFTQSISVLAYEYEHYAWSYYVALHMGFTERQAYQISSGAMSIDYDDNTNPMGHLGHVDKGLSALGIARPDLRRKWRRFHAFEAQVEDERQSQLDPDKTLQTENEELLFAYAVKQFNPGPLLHYIQDSFSHAGWLDLYGHGPAGHLTDYFSTYPEKAADMTNSTILNLFEFRNAVCESTPEHDICFRVRMPTSLSIERLNRVRQRMIDRLPNDSCGAYLTTTIKLNGDWDKSCQIKDVPAFLAAMKKQLNGFSQSGDFYAGLDTEKIVTEAGELMDRFVKEGAFEMTDFELETVLKLIEKSNSGLDSKTMLAIAVTMARISTIEYLYRYYAGGLSADAKSDALLMLDYTASAADQPLKPYLEVIRQAVAEDKESGLLDYVAEDVKNRKEFVKAIQQKSNPDIPEEWMKYAFDEYGQFKYGGPPVELESRKFISGLKNIEPAYSIVSGSGDSAIYRITLKVPVTLSGSKAIYLAPAYLDGEIVKGIDLLQKLPVIVTSDASGTELEGQGSDPDSQTVYVEDVDLYTDGQSASISETITLSIFRSAKELSADGVMWKVELYPYDFSRQTETYQLSVVVEEEPEPEPESEFEETTTTECPLTDELKRNLVKINIRDADGDGSYEDYIDCDYYMSRKTKQMYLSGVTPFVNRKEEGLERFYYENGNLKLERIFVGGKLNGMAIYYDRKGFISSKYPYVDGQYHGPLIDYYENGAVKSENNYVNGKSDGNHMSFSKDGKVSSCSIYRQGDWVGNCSQ